MSRPETEKEPLRRRRGDDRREPAPSARIEVAPPRVRAEVRPAARPKGRRATDAFDTWFVVAWRPVPTPSAEWVEWLRRAPFGSQNVRARRLRWDGTRLAIELMTEGEVEAYAAAMRDWVEFANVSSGKAGNTPERRVLREAKRRALEVEQKIRR